MDGVEVTKPCRYPALLLVGGTPGLAQVCRAFATQSGMLFLVSRLESATSLAARRPPRLVVVAEALLADHPWLLDLACGAGARLVCIPAAAEPGSVIDTLSIAALGIAA